LAYYMGAREIRIATLIASLPNTGIKPVSLVLLKTLGNEFRQKPDAQSLYNLKALIIRGARNGFPTYQSR
jgi:hypothetical protein